MSNFDIGTLLNFKPPKYFCEKCKALLYMMGFGLKENYIWCPVCKVIYIPSERYQLHQVEAYLESIGNVIKITTPIEHGQKLAAIAYNFKKNNPNYPPMRALFEALSIANSFIHFTTYGLSPSLLGALKLKAQTIKVRGIASNLSHNFANEIKEHKNEAENLEILIYEQGQPGQDWSNIPHQKLVVIDGLIAFKGAANMTDQGWRKAATGHDHIEVVTNIQEVVDLHNKLFSPIWAEQNKEMTKIRMEDFPPLWEE